MYLSDGTATGTLITSGAIVTVSSGGTAISATIDSGGTLDLVSGADPKGTTTISSGGTGSGLIVAPGAALELFGGAVLSGTTTISSGGSLEIASGYTLGLGVAIVGASGGIASGIKIDVLASGTTSLTIVNSGGTELVSSGKGFTSLTVVSSGGTEIVWVGARPTRPWSKTAARLIVLSGGRANNVIDEAGGVVVSSTGASTSGENPATSIGNGGTEIVTFGNVLGSASSYRTAGIGRSFRPAGSPTTRACQLRRQRGDFGPRLGDRDDGVERRVSPTYRAAARPTRPCCWPAPWKQSAPAAATPAR